MTDRRSPLDFYQPDGSAPLAPTRVGPKVEAPKWADLYAAQKTLAQADLPRADQEQAYEAWAPWVDLLNEGRPWNRRYHNPAAGGANPELYLFDEAGAFQFKAPSREDQEASLFAALDARRSDPRFRDAPKTLDEFHDQIVQRARQRVGAAREVTGRTGFTANLLAGIAAGVPTSFRDEYNIAAMPFGGIGRSIAARLGTAALGNMAVEAIEQPFIARQRERLGYDLTAEEVGINIAAAGVFGAAFQGFGEGLEAGARSQVARNTYARGREIASQMRERIGWDSMTPGERTAVTRLERDADVADLNPFEDGAGTEQHMARMEEARAALADGVPPPAPVQRSPADAARERREARETLKGKIRQVESGGDATIRNPRSSATGLYQFTDATWLAMVRGSPDAANMSDAHLLSMRSHPVWQERAMDRLLAHNERVLSRLGVPETAGNLYLLHFAGEGGGAKILRAAGDTPIERLLKPDAIAANPFLRGKTAEDVVAWAHAKMGTTPHDGPVLLRDGFDGDDDAWAAAQREVDAAEAELAALRRAADDADDPQVREVDTVPDEPAIPLAAQPVSDWTPAPYQPSMPGAETLRTMQDAAQVSEWLRTRTFNEDQFRGALSDVVNLRPEWARQVLDGIEGRQGGIPAADVARIVREVRRAEAPDPDPAPAASSTPASTRPRVSRQPRGSGGRAPVDLRRFLAEAGGIRDDAGHDLVRGRNLQTYVPGAGNLIRRTGMSIDEARQLAAEAGFWHDRTPDDALGSTTIADFLDLLDQASDGSRYRLADLGEVQERAERALLADERAYIENDLDERLSSYGMDLDADQTARIIDLVHRDGLHPDAAIVRVAQEDMQAAWAPERAAAQLDGWDDIDDAAARLQTDSMEHDLRMAVDEDGDLMVRVNEEGETMRAADILEDIDADDAAIAAARACMVPA